MISTILGRGRRAESLDEMIARADPNKIDANDLRRIFMSEEEKARIRAKSAINSRRRRENMTEEELAESKAKDHDRMARRNRKAKADEETRSQRKRANDHGKEARKCVNLDHDIRKHLRRCETVSFLKIKNTKTELIFREMKHKKQIMFY